MARITLQRLVKELNKLKPEPDAGRLKSHDYARRLARMIQQLRERGLDADPAAATEALAEALERGALTAPVEADRHNRLGPAGRRGPARGRVRPTSGAAPCTP